MSQVIAISGPLFLIGYRGTGKTTVAKLLAKQLHWASIDADDEVERLAGMTIREIFAREGEPSFRERESQVVAQLAEKNSTVVALGGGAILRPQNRQALAKRGLTVWLQAAPHTICQRLESDHATSTRRPNLTASGGYEEVQQLLATREPFYRQCADWSVDTEGRSPESVSEAIMDWLRHDARSDGSVREKSERPAKPPDK